MTSRNPDSPLHRRSIRLRGYDYSKPGLYFVALCTAGKTCLFGRIIGGEMLPNPAGAIVIRSWNGLAERFLMIQLACFVLMPNHVHGVIAIMGREFGVGKSGVLCRPAQGGASPAPTRLGPKLGEIVAAFKSISAIEVNRALGRKGTAVWQRNYFEHIVRDGEDLRHICRYIAENPSRWNEDPNNAFTA